MTLNGVPVASSLSPSASTTPRIRTQAPLPMVRHGSDGPIPLLTSFTGLRDPTEHVALIFPGRQQSRPFVRVHSECLTGDAFGSARCDCGAQLDEAVELLSERGGVLLYLRQEGRGIGLYNKLDAYRLQDAGRDTVDANLDLDLPADARDYTVAAEMLNALGVDDIVLITNNPDKVNGLRAAGITVRRTVRTGVYRTKYNRRYLRTKAARFHHDISA
jgi:GTP cyclohydrolase II